MLMPQTTTPQERLGEKIKQILNAFLNKHFVGYIKRGPISDYCQTSNFSGTSFRINLAFRLQKQQWYDCQNEKAVVEKKKIMEKQFMNTAGFTQFNIPQNKAITI